MVLGVLIGCRRWPLSGADGAGVYQRIEAHVVDPHLTDVDLAGDLEFEDEPGCFGRGMDDALKFRPAADRLQLLLDGGVVKLTPGQEGVSLFCAIRTRASPSVPAAIRYQNRNLILVL